MGNAGNETERKKWELLITDHLDHETAASIGELISSFPDPDLIAAGSVRSDAEYYKWKINDNPNGNGLFTLAVDEGKVVGTLAFIRRKIWFREQWMNPRRERRE